MAQYTAQVEAQEAARGVLLQRVAAIQSAQAVQAQVFRVLGSVTQSPTYTSIIKADRGAPACIQVWLPFKHTLI